MDWPKNRHLKFLLTLLYTLLALAGGYLFIRYLLKWFVPFIIAYLVSRLIEPAVRFLSVKCRLPRRLSCALCTAFAILILGTGVYFLVLRLVYELRGLSQEIPALIVSLPERLAVVTAFFDDFLVSLPDNMEQFIREGLASFSSMPKFTAPSYQSIYSGISWAANSVPNMVISIIATLVATYFISSDYDLIAAFIRRQIPSRIYEGFRHTKQHLVRTLGRWLRAQGILLTITFAELTLGFVILRLDYAGALAALVSLIDILPILGTGTILIPWAAVMLLSGEFGMALGLIILYAVVTIVRNFIEPKIVGTQIGLHPLVTLMCLYFGFQIFGFLGMFLMPVIVISLKELNECGYIHLWKTAPADGAQGDTPDAGTR